MATDLIPLSHFEDFKNWVATFVPSAPLPREVYLDAYASRRAERERVLRRQHHERVQELDGSVSVSEPNFLQIGVKLPSVPVTEEEAEELGIGMRPLNTSPSEISREYADKLGNDLKTQELLSRDRKDGPRIGREEFRQKYGVDPESDMANRMRAWMAQNGAQAVAEGMGQAVASGVGSFWQTALTGSPEVSGSSDREVEDSSDMNRQQRRSNATKSLQNRVEKLIQAGAAQLSPGGDLSELEGQVQEEFTKAGLAAPHPPKLRWTATNSIEVY